MSNFAMLRDEVLAEIETIAPVVREYTSQSEQLGRLAEPIIKAVRQTSLLRFICAHELGGCEADPLTVMEVTEALSRIDGSVGWTLGIIANATAFAGAFLPAESARRVFGSGVPIIVGAVQPRNSTAEPVDGGYLVNGRWSFGSGIHFADWVVAGALVPGQSPPAGLRVAVLPREQVTVHDNWQVAGLRGTGSCDFSIDNVFVPDNMTFSIMDAIHGNVVTGEKVMFRLGFPRSLPHFTWASRWELRVVRSTKSPHKQPARAAASRRQHHWPRNRNSRQHWGKSKCSSKRRGHWQCKRCRGVGRKSALGGHRRQYCKPKSVPLAPISTNWDNR